MLFQAATEVLSYRKTIYFEPQISDGSTLPWQIRLYKINFVWPMAGHSSAAVEYVYNFFGFLSFAAYIASFEAEVHYFWENLQTDGIEIIMENVTTTLSGIQLCSRLFRTIYKRKNFRYFIDAFYRDIYIPKNASNSASTLQHIGKQMLPIICSSYFYVFATTSFIGIPILEILQSSGSEYLNIYPFKMKFWTKSTDIGAYLFRYLYSCWMGISATMHIIAEDYLMALTLTHLTERFQLLHGELESLYDDVALESYGKGNDVLEFGRYRASRPPIRNEGSDREIIRSFSRKFNSILKKHKLYKSFAEDYENIFSFQCFLMMFWSRLLLCGIAFQFSTVTSGFGGLLKFFMWGLAALAEIFILGSMGSRLTEKSDQMSTKFYSCDWEKLLAGTHLTADSKEMLGVLKKIHIAIMLNKKPVKISGMKIIDLSIRSAFEAVQTSYSVFLFLRKTVKIN